jgi:hypothetical protein
MARGSGMPWREWNGHVDLSLEHRKNLMRFTKHSTTIFEIIVNYFVIR